MLQGKLKDKEEIKNAMETILNVGLSNRATLFSLPRSLVSRRVDLQSQTKLLQTIADNARHEANAI